MSHEICSPISSILNVTKEYSGLNPQKGLEVVGSISNYLLEFVNCLLQCLQAEGNGSQIKVFNDSFNVAVFLEEIKVMMEPLALQNKTSIKVEGSPREMMASDKKKLAQVVMNFMCNSIKFTTNGLIRLRFQRINPFLVRFTIEDNGVGMSDETKQKMFAPFNISGNLSIKNSQDIELGNGDFEGSA